MSHFIIIKPPHVAGTQSKSMTESQKAQLTYPASQITFSYGPNLNAQSLTETQKAALAYAIPSFNYA